VIHDILCLKRGLLFFFLLFGVVAVWRVTTYFWYAAFRGKMICIFIHVHCYSGGIWDYLLFVNSYFVSALASFIAV